MTYQSDYACSKHRTVKVYKNGKWVCLFCEKENKFESPFGDIFGKDNPFNDIFKGKK